MLLAWLNRPAIHSSSQSQYTSLEEWRAAVSCLESSCELPGEQLELPGEQPELPGEQLELPGEQLELPGEQPELPGEQLELPARRAAWVAWAS